MMQIEKISATVTATVPVRMTRGGKRKDGTVREPRNVALNVQRAALATVSGALCMSAATVLDTAVSGDVVNAGAYGDAGYTAAELAQLRGELENARHAVSIAEHHVRRGEGELQSVQRGMRRAAIRWRALIELYCCTPVLTENGHSLTNVPPRARREFVALSASAQVMLNTRTRVKRQLTTARVALTKRRENAADLERQHVAATAALTGLQLRAALKRENEDKRARERFGRHGLRVIGSSQHAANVRAARGGREYRRGYPGDISKDGWLKATLERRYKAGDLNRLLMPAILSTSTVRAVTEIHAVVMDGKLQLRGIFKLRNPRNVSATPSSTEQYYQRHARQLKPTRAEFTLVPFSLVPCGGDAAELQLLSKGAFDLEQKLSSDSEIRAQRVKVENARARVAATGGELKGVMKLLDSLLTVEQEFNGAKEGAQLKHARQRLSEAEAKLERTPQMLHGVANPAHSDAVALVAHWKHCAAFAEAGMLLDLPGMPGN